MKIIDLRSDTVTKPTPAMRKAMAAAAVGDDVYGEDPTVIELQKLAALLTGKEAALLVPTGTMANQASIMAQTRPGQEIVTAETCHIIRSEGGAVARLSGLSTAVSHNEDGKIYPEDLRRLVRARGNVHYPQTRLLCLENALGNGDVLSLDLMSQLYACAQEHELLVHLDGARLFNAASALNCTAKEIAYFTDSMTFCLSKGLCAPIGSMICGSSEFIEQAKYCRKVMGGGMRQAGIIAAACIVALEQMVERLADDHLLARHLAQKLAEIPEIKVQLEAVKINMVFWQPQAKNFHAENFLKFMLDKNIKVNGPYLGRYRLVTHHDVDSGDVDFFIACLKEYLKKLT